MQFELGRNSTVSANSVAIFIVLQKGYVKKSKLGF